MRFLLGWALKLSFLGVVYVALTSGYKLQLPETVMGFKVPEPARQWVDRNAQVGEYGKQAQEGFKVVADSFK